ncbi:DUF6279 family lipoprotein [Aestuariibacter salexigens]|uniref:DUF6279 family lipoprotein n=1 Tax=Aestuariibacter salexigens TaxID=226010 RepID=UPI0004101299|nr:DUF6279 family lipoprotein [Aestuariibacter salexigens]
MIKRVIFIFCSVLMLSACSSKMAYNNLDWLVYWYVDDFVELSDQQKDIADEKLLAWLQWHRQEELLAYRQHLEELKRDVQSQVVTAEQWQAHFERGRAHWLRLRDKVVPGLVDMAPLLSDEQVEALFSALEEENIEREEDRFEGSDEERIEERSKDMLKQLRNYIGRPTDKQKQLVNEYAAQMRSNYDNWIAYRRTIQQRAKALMLSRHDDPEFSKKLTQLMMDTDAFRSSQMQENSEHNGTLYQQMLEQMFLTLTEKQKRHVVGEIDDLIDDLSDLIED